MSKSKISITVNLDNKQIPSSIHLKDPNKETDCKAMMLSFFDLQSKDTLKIDLWTKDMQVLEMDRFMFETLRGMSETYFRSTGNQELANEFQKFTEYFGQKVGIVPDK